MPATRTRTLQPSSSAVFTPRVLSRFTDFTPRAFARARGCRRFARPLYAAHVPSLAISERGNGRPTQDLRPAVRTAGHRVPGRRRDAQARCCQMSWCARRRPASAWAHGARRCGKRHRPDSHAQGLAARVQGGQRRRRERTHACASRSSPRHLVSAAAGATASASSSCCGPRWISFAGRCRRSLSLSLSLFDVSYGFKGFIDLEIWNKRRDRTCVKKYGVAPPRARRRRSSQPRCRPFLSQTTSSAPPPRSSSAARPPAARRAHGLALERRPGGGRLSRGCRPGERESRRACVALGAERPHPFRGKRLRDPKYMGMLITSSTSTARPT